MTDDGREEDDERGAEDDRLSDDLFPEEPDEPEVSDEPQVAEAAPIPPTGDDGGTRKRRRWPWVFLAVLGIMVVTIGWTKVVNSDSYCTTCHSMDAAAETAAHSVHADVTCLSCHQGPGVPGAISYIPNFIREWADQLTPLSLADGILEPQACDACHTTIFTTPLLEEEHPSTGCNSCHGNTTHPAPPGPPEPITNPHPANWISFHGREADKDLDTCATCHLLGDENGSGTCMTCHFRGEFPHPKGWMELHGPQQQELGPDACTLCHAPTFCAGCHGTEIPHANTWLGSHYRSLRSAVPCLLCHARADCVMCHSQHGIHTQQSIFIKPGKGQP